MRRLFGVVLLAASAAEAFAQAVPALPPRYLLQPFAGTPATIGRDGPVAEAHIAAVTAMAVGPDGSLYFADRASIRRVAAGVVTTIAGVADVPGTADGPGASARFSATIGGIAVGADGTVFVADTGSHTIRRVTTDRMVSTWAGLPATAGLAYGRGASARFLSPRGVAVSPSGALLVIDHNCTLRRVAVDGTVSLVASLTLRAPCDDPLAAVAVDGASNAYVMRFSGTLLKVSPQGAVSNLASGFVNPRAIVVTPAGAVRVLRVALVSSSQQGVFGLGENMVEDVAADGSRSTVVQLQAHQWASDAFAGLAVDAEGVTYVANHDAMWTRTWTIDVIAADATTTHWIGTAPRFNEVNWIAAGADGSVMTAGENRQLRRITAGGVIGPVLHTTYAPSVGLVRVGDDFYFTDGQNIGSSPRTIGRLAADGRVSVVTTFDWYWSIHALAASPDGTLVAALEWCCSAGVRTIVRVTPSGVVSDLPLTWQPGDSLAVSPVTGDLYLGRSRVIRRYRADGSGGDVVAGDPAEGGLVDGSPGVARLNRAFQMRVSSDGSIFFLDVVRSESGTVLFSVLRQVRPTGDLVSLVAAPNLRDLALSDGPDVFVVGGRAVFRAVPATAAPLVMVSQPASTTVQAGASATFTIEATGGPVPVITWQVSRDRGGSWTTLTDPHGGDVLGPQLTLHGVTRLMDGYQYRANVADADETMVSHVVTLSVAGMQVSPSVLRFSVVRRFSGGGTFVTPPQSLVVSFTGGAPAWTVSASVPWLQAVADVSGGAGQIRVSVVNPWDTIGHISPQTGAVTIVPSDVSLPALTIPVTLVVTFAAGSAPPTGQVDTPAEGATGLQGAIAVTGWAVDDVGVQHVRLYRQCVGTDPAAACQPVLGTNLVWLGDASIVPGARPDVEALYPALPATNAAGWGFLILSNLLPDIPGGRDGGGVGTFQLYAVATDVEGNQTWLGRTVNDVMPTTITVANDVIAKPFGAIDTPGQGATVSGTLHNFGWALTPDPGTGVLIPPTGSTITVFIDGAPVGTATYNLCRGSVGNPVPPGVLCDDDVSSIFRNAGSFRNLDAARGPIALRTISTSALTNGLHTISWGVTDSANRSEGIGSRYFNVLNSSADSVAGGGRSFSFGTPAEAKASASTRSDATNPIFARTGYDVQTAYTPLEANADGVPQVRIPEHGRVELQIPGVVDGALIVNGDARALPVGVGIDRERGVVTWVAGAGYLGTYRLSFVVQGPTGSTVQGSIVDVTVVPATAADEPIRMHVDRIDREGPVITLHGWGLDPQAATGAGVGAVHVWARRLVQGPTEPARRSLGAGGSTVQGAKPVFLGVATLGIARPDVAAAHGAHIPNAGFVFTGVLPAEGEWEITAYVWVARTERFEDARSVTVTVR